ncbi:Vacuolar protein sorting-associated protein 9A [Linum perenne]
MESSDVFLGLHDFLERMRQPSAADFVKSIKSFIISFSNNAPDPEKDSSLVQEFFSKMEAAFRIHPLWAGCSEEELDSAGEGLEKYIMTKLFTRVFASLPDDVKADEQLFEKMSLIQQFVRPENLDIKPQFQNDTSWLANPPQFHSNLLYIQRYRRQSRLVGEASYCFTNMLSAESFISNIDAKSISMEETEYEKVPSLPDIENKGAALLLKEDNVEELLNSYKELVFKYVCVCKGLGVPSSDNQDPEQRNNVESSTKNREAESTEVVEQSSNQLSSIQNVSASPDFN